MWLRALVAACDHATASTNSLLAELAEKRGVAAVKPHKKALRRFTEVCELLHVREAEGFGEGTVTAEHHHLALGGILRGDMIARGILAAFEGTEQQERPIVVRMLGTNADIGCQILNDSPLNVVLVEDLDEVVDAIKAAN